MGGRRERMQRAYAKNQTATRRRGSDDDDEAVGCEILFYLRRGQSVTITHFDS